MQILESSLLGLRSARIVLVKPGTPVRITLFPMVHVGEAAFYEAVYADALTHDVILLEGVDSPIVRHVTRSYRWIRHSQRMNLCVQPRFPARAGQAVHADLSRDEFEAAWRDVPLWLRLAIWFLAPWVGLKRRLFGTREALAKGRSMDDQQSLDDLMNRDPETAGLNALILDRRDQRLLEVLQGQLDREDAGEIRVAVVYGAAHMRAVLRYLLGGRGYTVRDADWMTVFSL